MKQKAIIVRDDEACKNRQAVACIVCQKLYYPGLSTNRNRPRDAGGKLIPITRAEIKGYCSMVCQRQHTKPMSLDEFIRKHNDEHFPKNAFVTEPGFSELYVRIGSRFIENSLRKRVLDIARITAEKPGSGRFTQLVSRLQRMGFTLYVECVLNPRFADKLLRMGFTEVPLQDSKSFYLLNEKHDADK